MATRLHGVLLDGLNRPVINATVALIAKGNTITVLNGSEAIFRTDGEGAYNVTVQTGHYKVIIGPQGIEPYKAGEIVIYGDSPEGSLNGYLINWAPEELTPDVIKQVQQLVANSEEYALQAGRSAAAANADATDARNSKAAAATSASEALTYKNDSKTNADAAKQAQSSAAGSANTATQAVTTITNLKKDVEKLKSDTQTIKNNAVSETQAIKDAAVSETTALKDAAAASATKAGNSATEAGKQAGNASTSATAAKNDADRAKTEADRAESAANNAPEIQPLPDVWIPFNDSLDMITGFSPSYKKIIIGDDEITMPGDKIVKFKRASTATYINKSGVFTIAEIDEPRFEKDGLLIEGQRTNHIINGSTPSGWGRSPSITTTVNTDSFGFLYGKCAISESDIGSTAALNMASVIAAHSLDTSGDEKYVTASCRFRSDRDVRLRVRFAGGAGTDSIAFLGDAYIKLSDLSVNKTGGAADRISYKVETDVATGWNRVVVIIQSLENLINAQFQIAPVSAYVEGDYIELATPQVELGVGASSYIVTGTTPTTRSSDVVTIPSQNNLAVRPFTVLCEVNKNWTTPPNIAPRIFDVGGHQIDDNYLSLGFVSTGKLAANVGMIQPQIAVDGDKFVVGLRAKSDLSVNAIFNGNYTTNPNGKAFGVTATSYRFGGQTAAGTRHLFGHIRNFRIWFKELTDRQLKESV